MVRGSCRVPFMNCRPSGVKVWQILLTLEHLLGLQDPTC